MHAHPMVRRRRHLSGVLAVLTALALVSAGCGSDGDEDPAADPVGEESPDTSGPGDGADPDEPGTVSVTAVDYAFEGLPATAPAGSTFSLTNASQGEVHELVLIAVPERETRSVDELVRLPESELDALFAGEPALVTVAAPGAEGQAFVGDGTVSAPGRYVAICAIQIGADPDAYFEAAQTSEGPVQLDDAGPPHFTEGMFAEITLE